MGILTVNLVFSTVVFGLAAWLYVLPRLPTATPRAVLQPILLLHAMRHLGLMFLEPGATLPGIPRVFAVPAAYGDLLAAVLAVAALLALVAGSPVAKALVWLFTIEGTVDLAVAIVLATAYDTAAFMGAAYWIPAFWVPALLVTHYIAIVVLVRYWPAATR
jgi:hypothetical protein